ncbi:hypothetical protein PQU92_16570 [Asticcacaulis sp. BYS171W]|uniref:Uncharacterized protein n=1 Tax=Asticcacaulis aquaticus TaxID=2984212 RepID=A0ABT5HXU9_9CAUL|nr:hypothetical protein [Asticcacaulis aquaticus]MDC7684900.1 hypothetical protein [Asticcacaulis aquaticus]
MNKIFRYWLILCTSFYDWLLVIMFPLFWLFGKHNGKTVRRRTDDAFWNAVNYDPIPDEAEEAKKARRKRRKPGQLADFE